jgi:hypothetical protein
MGEVAVAPLQNPAVIWPCHAVSGSVPKPLIFTRRRIVNRLSQLSDTPESRRAGTSDLPEYVFTIRSADRMVDPPRVVACDNDDAALGYACLMVRNLKRAGGYDDPDLTVRVFDNRRPLIFCLPFLPARA